MPKTALTSSFRKIIESGSLYIDKTKVIYDLLAQATADDAYFFLARPRRFGKTLFISTLKELFEGNRELFKGLWIDSSNYNWEKCYVIALDFSAIESSSPENFLNDLALIIHKQAQNFGVDVSESPLPGRKLALLVNHLSKKSKVVILIDEYDYPLVSNLPDLEIIEGNRKILSNFFTMIKGLESELRALFITGVSQIPKASIFSGMNIPNNISLDPLAATLLGYTKEEIITHFSEDIAALAHEQNKSFDAVFKEIQDWYNGYRFSEAEVKVYNPFSLHYLFTKKKFANYWFRSGTPTFLLKLLKKNKYALEYVEGELVSEDNLSTLTVENPQLAPLLFQTGYLTIASYNKEMNDYTLTYPNHEVRQSYSLSLLSVITDKKDVELKGIAFKMKQALETNDMTTFCSLLGTLSAQIPYQIDKREEARYHALVQQLLALLEVTAFSEVQTNKGRIDLVAYTQKFIYLFEFKLGATAEKALAQIKKRTYYERFLVDPEKRTLVLVGLAFNKNDHETTVTCACKTIENR